MRIYKKNYILQFILLSLIVLCIKQYPYPGGVQNMILKCKIADVSVLIVRYH